MGWTPDSKQYTVSVVIPACNAKKFIARAIDSVLTQTHLPDEIIVVDDGSTDNTVQIVGQYCSKVKLIEQQNGGASVARNTGIEAATGEWIAFLDADDEWLPEKLQLQIDLLKRNPHLTWTTANFYRCLCNENRRLPDVSIAKLKALDNAKDCIVPYFHFFTQRMAGCTDTKIIKRQALIDAGLFLVGLKKMNDLDMWMRIAYRHPQIGFNPEPLAIYHLTIPQSISTRYKSTSMYHDFIRRHLALADELDCLDQFKPCAAFLIRRWIRGMLFESRGKEIKDLITEFYDLFSRRYKTGMTLLASFPQTTALVCHTISKIVRTLKLRKQAVRPPRKRIKS